MYNKIYKRKHDYNTLYDLVRIAKVFDDFKLQYYKEETDQNKLGISQNGKFTILAVLFYFYKKLFLNVSNDIETLEDNISGDLTINYSEDDYEKKLHDLFKYIIKRLSDLYEAKRLDLNLTSYSNFFKTDNRHIDIILKEFDRHLEDEWDRDKILDLMKIFVAKE